jgi:hypothetical protein
VQISACPKCRMSAFNFFWFSAITSHLITLYHIPCAGRGQFYEKVYTLFHPACTYDVSEAEYIPLPLH